VRPASFSGRKFPQRAEEIDPFVDLLLAEGVRSYLEIGARYGDSFHYVGKRLRAGSRLVAVDLPGGPGGRADSGPFLERAVADLCWHGHDALAVYGDSRDPDLIEQVRALGPFDAVFIDGDHSYCGARADWENYGSMGRIVAFHDIHGHPDKTFGVPRLWQAISRAHRHAEFLTARPGAGIGVVWAA
jgi:predicted O-methyltransferase YrrM